MPLYYNLVPGAKQTTNGTPNTENDCFFVSPGTRSLWFRYIYMTGRSSAATSLSPIIGHIKKWTATASSGGTGITPRPSDPGAQAAKQSAGFAAAAVVSGTGGPLFLGMLSCPIAGPGVPWVGTTPGGLDDAYMLEGSATQSIDLFNISPTASLDFEMEAKTTE